MSTKKNKSKNEKLIKNEKSKNIIEESSEEDDDIETEQEKINSSVEIIKQSNVIVPYINTTLVCPVMLYPNQMDNKIYLHIKSNLNNKLVGKCYKNYGFISKIFTIEEISDGVIQAEDPTCSAKIIVKFTCKLCYPPKNKEIICKIDRMNKALISAINGPIKVIITNDKINKEKFFTDINRNIRIKANSDILVPNLYHIRVLILSSSFSDYDRNILAIGYIQDLATEEEIDNFNKQQIGEDYDEY